MNDCLTWSELVLARRDSEAPALTGEHAVSYAELVELAAAAAGWLDELGYMFGQTGGSPIACLVPEDHERALTGRPDLLASVGRAAPGIGLRLENPGGKVLRRVLAQQS